MELIRLESARDPLYDRAFALYQDSFPLHEQRTGRGQEALMANPAYHFDVIVENGEFCGILLHWALQDYAYVEHLAIDASRRGSALGSRSLSAFCARSPLVILEIDPPVDEIAVRREGFYRRLGFCSNPHRHTHPAYRPENPPHELVVMSFPRELTQHEHARFVRDLEQVVMKDAER